ncbi:family 43 glycosylhydrolase [Mucilaginibacter sp. HME9299]|uniref:Family 43 glycosylhydrolase n=2 Tax=Mucilaginibacter aquatilis TaxID=1517760 RepID=A0A6I4I6P0_9SPHI|nr:family 43 glycosylhydrolase [Mucilaginibacter aquatilis]
MTATVTAGANKRTKKFTVKIAPEDPIFNGYLFSYFEGAGPKQTQEQIRFGVSSDAIHWTALNNNEPVLSSVNISSTGGVRDPHILRGEDDKTFFMVATDMFTVKNGWGYNPGIVLLRSKNLIDWSHGIINLEKSYPKLFPNVQWVWAPQTIYDPEVDKYLVYFTVKLKDKSALDFYCAYANKNFTAFENEPRLMFKAKYGAIDGDIVYKDGLYHFFYKGNTKNNDGKEIRNGIQQATAKSLRGPWVEDFKYIDAYSGTGTSVEGSGVFKLNNEDAYVLMYDLYGRLRYEFQRSTDLFTFTKTPETFTKNFYPRHGTVMSITRQEAERLSKEWTGVPAQLLGKQ